MSDWRINIRSDCKMSGYEEMTFVITANNYYTALARAGKEYHARINARITDLKGQGRFVRKTRVCSIKIGAYELDKDSMRKTML